MNIQIPKHGMYAVQPGVNDAKKVQQVMAELIKICQYDEVCERFYGAINQLSRDENDFIRRLANSVFSMVYFEPNPPTTQIIKTPRAALRTERGNCVDYTVFLGSIAKRGGLDVVIRIVKLPGQNNFGHVYPIINGIPVDLVPGQDQSGAEYLTRQPGAAPRIGHELNYIDKFDIFV